MLGIPAGSHTFAVSSGGELERVERGEDKGDKLLPVWNTRWSTPPRRSRLTIRLRSSSSKRLDNVEGRDSCDHSESKQLKEVGF